MNARRYSGWLSGALRLVLGLAAAGMLGVAGQAAAGISATKHNLGSTGTGANKTSSTDEICVFCHTPHASDTTAPAPLWNKSLSTLGGYTTYATLNSSTIDGAFASDGVGGSSVGSVSLACLSCHDGTQAMDNIINAPGSGGYSATGGGATGLNWSWTGSARADADGKLTNASDTLAMLGTDLKNDHPIGIQYCGGGITPTNQTGTCKDKDFYGSSANNSRLNAATINSNLVWWVDTGTPNATREKTDMILYTRNFSGTTSPSVECASCHDPHTDAQPTFLRVTNTGSGVCLSCHVK
jgi:predicted CXXCH cytochrome family protein